MTRDEAAKLLPVIQAYAEGKTVQIRCSIAEDNAWQDYTGKCANFSNSSNWEWRVKPQAREWWVSMRHDKSIIKAFLSLDDAKLNTPSGSHYEIIHVREFTDEA